MDPIKEAFLKAKQDILNLQSQLELLKQELQSLKRTLQSIQQTDKPTDSSLDSTFQQITSTHPETPTDDSSFKASKPLFSHVSIGNKGVPADRQTNQQTDRHIEESSLNLSYSQPQNTQNSADNFPEYKLDKISQIARVSDILDSLDSIKKEIRSDFKRLTHQEMLIFSTIYQLEEEHFVVDYPLVSSKLSLSQSSVRDYVQKIIKKGIPIQKSKENNKKIILSISQNLKKIASLQTILALREL